MNACREKIYRFLLQSISEGRYAPNERIPTEQELGVMFSTHRLNAHYAVKQLQEHGVLRRNRKQGTFVNRMPVPYLMGELKSKVLRRICVLNTVVPQSQQIHWNQRLTAPLEAGLHEANIEVLFEDVSELISVNAYRDFLANLITQGFNALLLIPEDIQGPNTPATKKPDLLFEFHHNVFIFDRGVLHWNNWPYNIVSINVFGEGVLVAKHLANQKIKHVVFCHMGTPHPLWLMERMNGLQFGLHREAQKKWPLISYKFELEKQNPTFFKKIRQLLNTGSTALVAQNDKVAAAIIDQASELGLQAGRDLSVIGFDDNTMFESYNLTTVSPSLERIGQQLAHMIRNNLDQEDCSDITCTKVNSKLKIRATG